ncbi:MAG: oligosaccharide flippase family protein [Elusimicrobia bacterium]|nr:oligosaccharide flippase family protein [Elusimicrobiota bacterium]
MTPPEGGGRFSRVAANVRYNVYGQALRTLVPFFTTPFIVRRLGPEPYSLVALIGTLVSQFNLLGFGANTAAVKFLAELDPAREPERVGSVFGNTLTFYGTAGLAGAALLAAAGPTLAPHFLRMSPGMRKVSTALFLCAAATFLLQFFAAAFQAVPRALQRFDIVNALDTATSVAYPVGACALLALGFWVRAMAAWQAVVALGALLCYATFTRRLLPGAPLRPRREPPVLRRLVHFGGLVFLVQVAWSVLNQLDKVALGFTLPLKDLVYYIIAFNLAQKLAVLPGPVISVLLPVSSQLASQRDERLARKLLASATKLMFMLVSLPALLGVCFGPAFLELWLGGEYSLHGGWILRWLIAANFAPCLLGVAFEMSVGFGRLRTPTLLYIGAACAAALSWPFLLPRFGTAAATGAFVAANFLYCAALLVWVYRSLFSSPARGFLAALLRPALLLLPFALVSALLRNSLRTWSSLGLYGAAAAAAWALVCWRWGLDDEERARLAALRRPAA